jgi:CBS domain-containing protein
MRCEELMHRKVEMVKIDDTILDAARRMRDRDIGFLPVVDASGKAVGVITDRDITVRAVAGGWTGSSRIGDLMTRDLIACHPDDDLEECVQLMAKHEVSRVLVVNDDGTPCGVISLGDIAVEDEAEAGDTLAAVKEGVEQHP